MKNFLFHSLTIIFFYIPTFLMMVGSYSDNSFKNDDLITVTDLKDSTYYLSIKKLIIKTATYFINGKENVDLIPYNQTIIACLKDFNYDEFLKEKKGGQTQRFFRNIKKNRRKA